MTALHVRRFSTFLALWPGLPVLLLPSNDVAVKRAIERMLPRHSRLPWVLACNSAELSGTYCPKLFSRQRERARLASGGLVLESQSSVDLFHL